MHDQAAKLCAFVYLCQKYKKVKKHIPNIITLLNLTAGGIASVEAVNGNLKNVIWLILAAAVFDFADGLVARALKVKSDVGKELDSLADVVSFGLVPGLVVFYLLGQIPDLPHPFLAYIAFLLPAFSAYRLAKFNLDTRQSDSFLGVPTPAMALFFIMIPLASSMGNTESTMINIMGWLMNSWLALTLLVVFFSLLMISEIPLLALKFKNLSWHSNKERYLMLAGCGLLTGVLGIGAMPLVVIWYIVFSAVTTLVK